MSLDHLELQPKLPILCSQRLTAPLEGEQGLGQAGERVVLLADAPSQARQLSRGWIRRRRGGAPEEGRWQLFGGGHGRDGTWGRAPAGRVGPALGRGR